jgi:hypothetical protein
VVDFLVPLFRDVPVRGIKKIQHQSRAGVLRTIIAFRRLDRLAEDALGREDTFWL